MSIRIHNGTEWQEISDLKRFSNGQWQSAELKRYDGTDWEQLWPCHFTYTKEYPLAAYIVSRGKDSNQFQIADPEHIISGNPEYMAINKLHDSLLFFDMEKLRADLSGALLLETSLRLTRLAKAVDKGPNSSKVMIASALSGVDLSRTDNLWPRVFTNLLDSHFTLALEETKTVSFAPSGVADLLSGAADCLCLPTTDRYVTNIESYCLIDPDSVALIVTYYI